MNMEQKFYKIFRKSTAARLLLLVSLLVGGGDFVWGTPIDISEGYTYGFETTLATEGWTLNNAGTSTIQSLGGTAHSGSSYFRFIYNENPPQYLISPELNPSISGTTVSFYQKGQGDSYPISYNIGYSTSGTNVEDFSWSQVIEYSSNSYKLQEITFNVSGIKYIAFRFNTSASVWGYYMYLDDITISSYNSFKTPTSFALNSYSANSATFSWTAGNSETAWQFDYSTDPDFTPGSGINGTSGDITTGDLIDGKYTLSGLTTNTTYYASIRANYGEGNYSEWTDKVSFTPRAETETTINDATGKSSYIPLYGSGGNDTSNKSQFILPSSQLSNIAGRQITKIVFHTSTASVDWGTAQWEVYMNEVTTTSFSSQELMSFGTKVFNAAQLSVNNNELSITLDTPYNYIGGNLLIGFKTPTAGKYGWCTFYGVSASSGTNNGLYGTASLSYASFYPKMTITTIPVTTAPVKIGTTGFTTFASAWPLDLSTLPDGLTAYYASSQNGSNVTLTKATTEVSAGTGLVLKGTAGQTYAIPVAASGSDIAGNLLVGVTSETAVAASATKYVLVNNGGTAEFQSLEDNGATIPAGKAYLNTAGAGARLTILFDDDDTTTSIKTTKGIDKANIIYNLMGQKVKGSKPGLYIKNGKKVVKK